MSGVQLMQSAKLLPKEVFKLKLVSFSRRLENGNEGRVLAQTSPHWRFASVSPKGRERARAINRGVVVVSIIALRAEGSSFSLREKVRMRVLLGLASSKIVKPRRKFDCCGLASQLAIHSQGVRI
jgi:hypothetical protein